MQKLLKKINYKLVGYLCPLRGYPSPAVPIIRNLFGKYKAVYLICNNDNLELQTEPVVATADFFRLSDCEKSIKKKLKKFDYSKHRLFAISESNVDFYEPKDETYFFIKLLIDKNFSKEESLVRVLLAKATGVRDFFDRESLIYEQYLQDNYPSEVEFWNEDKKAIDNKLQSGERLLEEIANRLSRESITKLNNSFEVVTKVAVAVVVLLLIGSNIFSFYQYQLAQKNIEIARLSEQKAKEQARKILEAASQSLQKIEAARQNADKQRKLAEQRLQELEAARQNADKQRKLAEQRLQELEAARQNADKQRKLAEQRLQELRNTQKTTRISVNSTQFNSSIIEVTVGLLLIHLILSLLASEIQELIATVLQWRAEHLRRSIEILLAGDVENSESPEVIQLVNKIYSHPLIQSINQEAKGLLATLPRKATWALGSFFSSLRKSSSRFKRETVFGDQKRSAPSYIGGESFANTFMDTLQLPLLVKKLTKIRLEQFKNERLDNVRQILIQLQVYINNQELSSEFTTDIATDYKQLELEYNRIIDEFNKDKYDIYMAMNRMRDSLNKYINSFHAHIDNHEDILDKPLRELKFLKQDIFENAEKAIVIGGLKPNINEIIKSIKKGSDIHNEVIAAIQDKDSETYKKVKELIDILPDSVVDSIETMAKRAPMRAKSTEEGITLLQKEIENSFDSSMERAGGVYKRNAKGVAILIGITLAITANADIFHIINRLSKDSLLRSIIVNKAIQIAPNTSNPSGVNNIDHNEILKEVELPIGWTNANLQQQINRRKYRINGLPVFSILSMVAGWLISGLAISMGASFWFDLLGKVVIVRNSGKKPK